MHLSSAGPGSKPVLSAYYLRGSGQVVSPWCLGVLTRKVGAICIPVLQDGCKEKLARKCLPQCLAQGKGCVLAVLAAVEFIIRAEGFVSNFSSLISD